MRKIPTTIATQHPDNARKLSWYNKPVVSTLAELSECFVCFSDLGIDEYNWDWEGKFVDESVVDRLLHRHYDYFRRKPLGKEKFLTFRIPNPRVEKQFRLGRAFMVAITNSQLAKSLGFTHPPIFEMILPLTETVEDIIDIQMAFQQLVRVDHKLLKMEDSVKNIEVIPLFEQVGKIIESPQIIEEYLKVLKINLGIKPSYIRPYVARSDPALNSGLVPTILALKVALSGYQEVEKKTGVEMYPMLGTGSLPFRGSVSPENIDFILEEYAGIATLTLQSAFRYDYEESDVIKAVRKLKKYLPKGKAQALTAADIAAIKEVIPLFEQEYRQAVEKLSPLINKISSEFPRRRERLQHIGLFGYSRGIGQVKLPRAIPFTGSLYSIGIPPELIGTGRGIKKAKEKGLWDRVSPFYIHLKNDLIRAGYYLNKENLELLAKDFAGWKDLKDDIKYIEEELEIEMGPKERYHEEHHKIAGIIYSKLKNKKKISEHITEAGILRKSLG